MDREEFRKWLSVTVAKIPGLKVEAITEDDNRQEYLNVIKAYIEKKGNDPKKWIQDPMFFPWVEEKNYAICGREIIVFDKGSNQFERRQYFLIKPLGRPKLSLRVDEMGIYKKKFSEIGVTLEELALREAKEEKASQG